MFPFSVLLSIYYKESPLFLVQSLDSIFEQTVRANEVILVEDGPLTPQLYAIIEKYAQEYQELKIVRLPKNVGLGNALNEGLKHCSFELVARMDTDDICKPYRFERQLKIFETMPQIDVCSSWVDEFIENKENIVSQRRLPEWQEEIFHYAKGRCPVNHPAVMYKRKKVIEVGGYQGFPEDSYLWVKMLLRGDQFYNIQESLLWFRFSPDVVKRRGGLKYAMDDLKAQWNFYQLGFLSKTELIKYSFIRCGVRLLPNSLRIKFYQFLRKR